MESVRDPADSTSATELQAELLRLGKSLQTGRPELVREAAARLRRLLRTSRPSLDQAGVLLLDATTAPELREVLALVLGSLSIEEAQALLSRALDAASSGSWIRTLLIALGSTKFEGDDDDVFGDSGRPWVVDMPSGLAITVMSRIESGYIRSQMLRYLHPGTLESVREAAIQALRHSLEYPDVRRDFRSNLASERNEDLRGEVAQGLAEWARKQSLASPDRQDILASILAQSRKAETAAVRFGTEATLKQMPMNDAEVKAVADFLHSPDYDQRRWAFAILGFKAESKELPARAELLPMFGQILSRDPDPKIREYAAGALGAFGDRPEGRTLLLHALSDPIWHVRAGAAAALARSGEDPRVLEALNLLAKSDANESVRRTAEKSLKALAR